MKNLLLLLTLSALFGCTKSSEMKIDYYNLDVGLEFSVYNSQNEDLLNPNNANHLDVVRIKLFYEINGEKQEVYNPNMDNPRNFKIYKHENEYRIGIIPNHSETLNKAITYIQWNAQNTDKIEVSYIKTEDAIIHNKIWINGEQVWERTGNALDPYFVLIK